jgi:sRNA-binding carbon storage regulator CsrA
VKIPGWLVLERHTGECVFLSLPDGRRIIIRITHTSRGKAKLAFLAPRDVAILRDDAARRTASPDDARKEEA